MQLTPAEVFLQRMPRRRRALVLAAVATLLAASALGARPAAAQASRFAAEISTIDAAEKRVTLKSSMGQLTVRVAPAVALDGYKAGDKVWVTFGQDGTEPVLTSLEIVKP